MKLLWNCFVLYTYYQRERARENSEKERFKMQNYWYIYIYIHIIYIYVGKRNKYAKNPKGKSVFYVFIYFSIKFFIIFQYINSCWEAFPALFSCSLLNEVWSKLETLDVVFTFVQLKEKIYVENWENVKKIVKSLWEILALSNVNVINKSDSWAWIENIVASRKIKSSRCIIILHLNYFF